MDLDIQKLSAYFFALLVSLAALLHLYWVLGGTWFLYEASGGAIEPGATFSPLLKLIGWAMIAGLLLAAVLALGRAGIILQNWPQWIFLVSSWGMAALMLLGAVFNFIIPRFLDRFVFGPIFLLLAILLIIIALPGKGPN